MDNAFSRQLKALNMKRERDKETGKSFARESPLDRVKTEMKELIIKEETIRVSVLQKVAAFGSLSVNELKGMSRNMIAAHMKKGEYVIRQDHIGEAFFILEEGVVEVWKRKAGSHDSHQTILATLHPGSYFGDVALQTDEVCSASIVVVSDYAKCAKMTRNEFEKNMKAAQNEANDTKRKISVEVLDSTSIFETLSISQRKDIANAMTMINFPPNTYICRQGKFGNTFFIITSGSCRVTLNQEGDDEFEITNLGVGEFFGELALTDPRCKRTANVISKELCCCMSLSRVEFLLLPEVVKNRIFSEKEIHSNAMESSDDVRSQETHLLIKKNAERRRISCLALDNTKSDSRSLSFIRCMCKFFVESLWTSMYGRLARRMILFPYKLDEIGGHSKKLMKQAHLMAHKAVSTHASTKPCSMSLSMFTHAFIHPPVPQRAHLVEAIITATQHALSVPASRRTSADHDLIIALLQQRNKLKDTLCVKWPMYQFKALCQHVKLVQHAGGKKVYEAGTIGTMAYLILKGCVRAFSHHIEAGTNRKVLVYEEDLGPGDVFGEDCLGGTPKRFHTMLALTNIDLIAIDEEVFNHSHDKCHTQLSVDDRFKFLSQVPFFTDFEPYRLYRVAHVLRQVEYEKNCVVLGRQHHRHDHHMDGSVVEQPVGHILGDPTQEKEGSASSVNATFQNSVSHSLQFVVHGRLDVVVSPKHSNELITTLHKFDYFGEYDILNAHHVRNSKGSQQTVNDQDLVVDKFTTITISKVDVLILTSEFYNLLYDSHSIHNLRNAFIARHTWRESRKNHLKAERGKLPQLKMELFSRNHLAEIEEANRIDSEARTQSYRAPVSSQEVQAPTLDADITNDEGTLKELYDIPVLLNRDFNPLLQMGVCKNDREIQKAHSSISYLQLPVGGRKKYDLSLNQRPNTSDSLRRLLTAEALLKSDSSSQASGSLASSFGNSCFNSLKSDSSQIVSMSDGGSRLGSSHSHRKLLSTRGNSGNNFGSSGLGKSFSLASDLDSTSNASFGMDDASSLGFSTVRPVPLDFRFHDHKSAAGSFHKANRFDSTGLTSPESCNVSVSSSLSSPSLPKISRPKNVHDASMTTYPLMASRTLRGPIGSRKTTR